MKCDRTANKKTEIQFVVMSRYVKANRELIRYNAFNEL